MNLAQNILLSFAASDDRPNGADNGTLYNNVY